MSNKTSTIGRIWLTMTEPEARGIFSGLFLAALVCLLMLYVATGVIAIVAVGLLVGIAALAGYVTYVGMSTYDQFETRMLRARAVQWARDARTAEERASRMDSIMTLGAAGALTSAGVTIDSLPMPTVNVDGTLMLAGGIDINGNIFGMTNSPEFMSDAESFCGDDFSAGGYQSPIGMDPSLDHHSF